MPRPSRARGEVEMIRMLKIAKDSAVKARTQAINQMKALVVTAPAELRETLDRLPAGALTARCKSFRPGRLDNPTAAAKYALRSLAGRYRQLSEEIHDLKAELERLTQTASPTLVSMFGVGPDTAATLLVTAGSNPERLHSEAAFAALWRGESDTCFLREDQPASLEPRWRPPSQCGSTPHRRGQASLRPPHQGLHVPPHR